MRTVLLKNEVVTRPPSDVQSVTLQSGQAATARHLGVFKLGTINVDVREDKNGDGSVSVSDPSLPGWRVFLDLDRDGHFDEGIEPAVITGKAIGGAAKRHTGLFDRGHL